MDFYLIFGITGASLILLGFVRVNSGKWGSKSLWYELDNLVGASLVSVYNFHHGAYATMVLNVIWVIVAITGLKSLAQRRRAVRKNVK